MKIIEGVIKIVLWLALIVSIFVFGWLARSYKYNRESK